MKPLVLAFLVFSWIAWSGISVPAGEPVPLKPFNLEALNTANDEDDPHVSADWLQLFYASNAEGKFDILVSQRTKVDPASRWPAGRSVEGYIQSKGDDRSVFLTAREDRGKGPQFLYFATRKDRDKEASFDIFVSMKLTAKSDFGLAGPVQPVCSAQDEMHPWLTADGKQLYFSRKTPEGWRVFVSTRPKATGPSGFAKPQPVELPIGFHHPTVTPDSRIMYLQGPVDNDRWGLFRTTRTPTGWTEPQPLTGLNHPEGKTGDRSPCLSREGAYLFFASDRPGGKGGLDLWVIAVAELNRKK